MDEVLRYFVVHNFVVNGDSYTGSMIHNYYLHEEDGKLGMIPWDYNLAFGTFQGGNASDSVNSDIDNPVSGSMDDRPMVGWIFSDEEYTGEYHRLFSEFIGKWFSDSELEKLISDTADLIRPYVEKDPTKFCSSEDFEKGVTALSEFVSLRGEAVKRQLDGDTTAVDTSSLNVSDMGTMGGTMGRGGSKTDRKGSGDDTDADVSGAPSEDSDPRTESVPADGKPQDENSTGKRWDRNNFPGTGDGSFSMPDGTRTKTSSSSVNTYILLGVSVLVLAAGIIIAVKKKH